MYEDNEKRENTEKMKYQNWYQVLDKGLSNNNDKEIAEQLIKMNTIYN